MSQGEAHRVTEPLPLAAQPSSPLAFPRERYPTGWFQIGWSDEISPGEVALVRYFGEDIVLWRGESGRLNALDAYCQHLGGNLGVGGTVSGEHIVCPWHGWNWNGEGRNTLIPYSKQKCKENVAIARWQVAEWYGCIMIWHDLGGSPPLWDLERIPDLENDSFFPMVADMRATHRIRAHPQMPLENAADLFHVAFVHQGEISDIVRFEFNGYCLEVDVGITYGAGKDSSWLTPAGEQKALIRSHSWGIGHTWLRWPAEIMAGIQFTNVTPVDETHCDYFFGMTVERAASGDDQRPTGLARKMIDHQMKIIEQDFFTWENMKVLDSPNFAPEEAKNYGALRRWAWHFYSERVRGNGAAGGRPQP